MSNSPHLSIVYDLIQHGRATTPKELAKRLKNITKRERRPFTPSEPIEIIDLTKSPLSLESSRANEDPHDHNFDSFIKHLNSPYAVHNRRLHPNWKCVQVKNKSDLLTNMYASASGSLRAVQSLANDRRYMSPRTPNVQQKYSPKQVLKRTQAKPASADSPFTPENQVELRPLRGYRLQDVLHRQPITPINYYKKTSFCVDDSN